MLPRYSIAAAFSVVITFALFLQMNALTSVSAGASGETTPGRVIEFVRLVKDSEPRVRERRRPKHESPEEPPPAPALRLPRASRPARDLGGVAPAFDLPLDTIAALSAGSAPMDADVVPLVRVNPQYPVRAAERGIEGWVLVEFTITAAGTVRDAAVLDSKPGAMFDRAALQAVRKWKYKPRIVDGAAVERPGVTVRLEFELED